jgi:hypothetical protein
MDMKRILVVIPYKNLLIGILTVCIVIVCLLCMRFFELKSLQVTEPTEDKDIGELQKENQILKETLEHLLPGEQKVAYENPYRAYGDYKPPFKTVASLQEVIEKGKKINFTVLYNEPQYLRPIYDSSWKGFYFRGWTYLPDKVEEARHRLFVFPLGASSNFDFTGSLGFDYNKYTSKNIIIDSHRNINFLILFF